MRWLLLAAAVAIYGVVVLAVDASDEPAVKSVVYVESTMPETEGQCLCGTDCKCREATIRKSRTVEPTIKQDLTVDPVTKRAVSGPTVIQLTLEGCAPCVNWMGQEAPKYVRQGWAVAEPVYGVSAPRYPSFRVWDGKRWHSHAGWMTTDDVRRMLGESPQTPPQSTNQIAGSAQSTNCNCALCQAGRALASQAVGDASSPCGPNGCPPPRRGVFGRWR